MTGISDLQCERLTRVSGRARSIAGLSPQRQTQAATDTVGDRPEQRLLAHVFGKFKEGDLLDIETEAQEMLMRAALNLGECIAETIPETAAMSGPA